eukprot:TRINITY_DN8413_c0_g3_i1.p1 TRINITY_DN8413_c0_g3~~TRINITY_DN8413_c0_g3_i1.p1  ORF type:complete len:307 (+),score=65.31 TRINITY_DN8413_c0_g3_i1:711-1631(+)
MKKLAIPALVADVFIILGLVTVFYFAIDGIAVNGAKSVLLFNPPSFPLFIGTAVYTFEGIGLMIPIYDAMLEKKKFVGLLSGTMVLLVLLFVCFSVVVYLAWGDQIESIALVNLSNKYVFVIVVKIFYVLAMWCTFPLQFFPAIRIIENQIFPRHKLINEHLQLVEGSGKYSSTDELPKSFQTGRISTFVTWKKNALRASIVVILIILAILGANQLESFISIIGGVCCIPLAFIYPSLFHLKLVASTTWSKVLDVIYIVLGVVAMVASTVIAIVAWVHMESSSPRPCIPYPTNFTNVTMPPNHTFY